MSLQKKSVLERLNSVCSCRAQVGRFSLWKGLQSLKRNESLFLGASAVLENEGWRPLLTLVEMEVVKFVSSINEQRTSPSICQHRRLNHKRRGTFPFSSGLRLAFRRRSSPLFPAAQTHGQVPHLCLDVRGSEHREWLENPTRGWQTQPAAGSRARLKADDTQHVL